MTGSVINRIGALGAVALMLCSVFAIGGAAAQTGAANESVEITNTPITDLENSAGETVDVNVSIAADAEITSNITVSIADSNGSVVHSYEMTGITVPSGGPTTSALEVNADPIPESGEYTVQVGFGDASDSAQLSVVKPSTSTPTESPTDGEDQPGGGVLPENGSNLLVLIGALASIILAVVALVIND